MIMAKGTNREYEYEYREDRQEQDAQKRAAVTGLYHMDNPYSPDPLDANQFAFLQTGGKFRSVVTLKRVVIAVLILLGIRGIIYLLQLAGLF